MNTLVHLVMLVLAVVCVGIPVVAVLSVYREELPAIWDRARRALAFDPRHAALDDSLNR